MFTLKNIIIATFAILIAPVIGGIINGLDRKLTAKLQGRYGPPLLQPFYDLFKLFGKEKKIVNRAQVFCVWIYLISSISALFLFAVGSDLLMIFFVLTLGSVFLIIGATVTPSPYSQIGAQRELIQMLTYEPLLIVVFVSIYFVTGSFKITDIINYPKPIFLSLPLIYLVLGFALTIKLRKSPFDISTSHHGHQEIVKGVLTEFAGPHLGLIELAHWYEIMLVLSICGLFWATDVIGLLILLVITYLAEIVVDNLVSRATWRWMLTYVWGVGISLVFFNIAFLYASKFVN
jgi:ech hydrogenase subunit B